MAYEGPVLDAATGIGPMRPLDLRSVRYITVSPPRAVEVLVTEGVGDPQWCHGELVEWTLFPEPVGWTAWCRYNVTADQRFNGRFAAAHVRPAEDDPLPDPST